jgi:signal transduction histidine kinase
VRAISAGLGLPELGPLALAEVVSRVVSAHEWRTGTRVALSTQALPEQPPLSIKITVYRLIQEALTNAYRHAGGAGQAVSVAGDGDMVRVVVSDTGPGFDVMHPGSGGEGDGRVRLGLAGMRERVQSLGGSFTVDSTPGHGATIRASLSLHVPADVYDR